MYRLTTYLLPRWTSETIHRFRSMFNIALRTQTLCWSTGAKNQCPTFHKRGRASRRERVSTGGNSKRGPRRRGLVLIIKDSGQRLKPIRLQVEFAVVRSILHLDGNCAAWAAVTAELMRCWLEMSISMSLPAAAHVRVSLTRRVCAVAIPRQVA